MLELLSDVLRQVLRADSSHETTLSNEVAFLGRYLAIEQVRFSDRLRPNIQIDQSVSQALVPVFLLQPLVENAIRHGIASRADAGVIEVRGTREGAELVLTVRDDGVSPSDSATGRDTLEEGIGLSNMRARLRTMYGDAARLETRFGEDGGFIATVRLPYREASSTNEANPYSHS
jgi:two-component system LytT family sensor kinase